MQPRLDGKLALLYTLLVLQVLIVMIYVATTPPSELTMSTTHTSVTFVKFEEQQKPKIRRTIHKKFPIYQTINEEVVLNEIKTFTLFEVYNHTICWKHGVDDQKMRSSEDLQKCICIHGWHGSDCGQPEVVWRAIMASKQNVNLKHRKIARRIIHTFFLHEHNSAIAEVIVEELYNVVDLFVICDFSNAEDNFHHKLFKGLLQQKQKKILYINIATKMHKPSRIVSKYIWDKLKTVVRNLRDDDIYITTEPEQILNSRALMFLKVYNGWPQPIGFRLRWSVYGFFWQHPLKTTITVGACTIGLMREAYQSNSIMLEQLEGDLSERDSLGLVIGDLNHYGGWYCYLCQAPANIITNLHNKVKSKEIQIEKTIDVPFIEDLIGSGLWLDGKTNLLRVSKSQDLYFAPETILNNTWKYDWLVENFYAKLDYY
ncbi:beta-1,4-mannosyl-glycoprotein 4-beta-N-acetylglucosaminyltransferase [Bombus pascuorum]|uniref:beta-1,4-mannosyl-glycoprotein 4-beta-N-acetylglucosaminyltransferase n=1 Tax=Bombus pascuorum TaxID=65598 RepID=UPI00298E8744|nr:beta-1,4-mannosyl-glycoprotein 4-beta-N-acetylglucosaminyltransferase [Bombus pascuorum]XP_060819642.1 beta-1,4-mannosyl-glycoprotein 4-beta-N-acetylglucosaminyltransferase [Bombus pascuorum]